MRKPMLWIAALAIMVPALQSTAAQSQTKVETTISKPEAEKTEQFKPEQQASKGSVTVEGHAIAYDAFAGTLVVHPKGWDDVPQNADKDDKSAPTEASMFYVAYMKSDE
ncbi:MAG: hypothetical protein WA765_06915, partial [Candidatus Acidiferrum sp.]